MVNGNSRLLVMSGLLGGLVGGAVAVLMFMTSSVVAQPVPADTPQVITAQEFRLVDAKGRIRAILDLTDEGQPYLQFRDEFDTYRLWMGISSETGLAVHDVDGKTRLILSVDNDGKPSLVVRDRDIPYDPWTWTTVG